MKRMGICLTRNGRSDGGGLFSRMVLRPIFIGAGALLVASCHSPAEESEISGVAAEEICGGILAADAATALEDLSGMTQFGELPEDPAIELSNSIARLRSAEPGEEKICSVYALPDSDLPSVTISFEWVLPNFSGDGRRYDTGMNATVLPNTAIIAFRCEGEDYPSEKVMLGRLSIRSGAGTSEGRMAIVNSASRAVAEELGCLDESGLVEGVPQPLGD